MAFGEPDLDIVHKDGKLTIYLKGLDVYDPTTGENRSNSTDKIACWFVDTDYNGESFIVRYAYFTGSHNPYDKLKHALKTEIDEAAWSSLFSRQSYPFEKTKAGKLAVKVINHYGDEILKVYDAGQLSTKCRWLHIVPVVLGRWIANKPSKSPHPISRTGPKTATPYTTPFPLYILIVTLMLLQVNKKSC
jgi:hypothetical protein